MPLFPKEIFIYRFEIPWAVSTIDEDFTDLFSVRGQPAQSPWRLALISVMQYIENLSDRQAADAVRGRIDWKYALSLPLDDAGFNFSVLSEFRQRLIAGGKEELLLERILEQLRSQGLLKGHQRQRTDSTHILAAIRPRIAARNFGRDISGSPE